MKKIALSLFTLAIALAPLSVLAQDAPFKYGDYGVPESDNSAVDDTAEDISTYKERF